MFFVRNGYKATEIWFLFAIANCFVSVTNAPRRNKSTPDGTLIFEQASCTRACLKCRIVNQEYLRPSSVHANFLSWMLIGKDAKAQTGRCIR
eukprot:6284364-Amphidinium_carterae.1